MADKLVTALGLATQMFSTLSTSEEKKIMKLKIELLEKQLEEQNSKIHDLEHKNALEIQTQEAIIQSLEVKNTAETQKQNEAIKNLEAKKSLETEILLRLLLEEKIKNGLSSELKDQTVSNQQPQSTQSNELHVSVSTPNAEISIQQDSSGKASKNQIPQNVNNTGSHQARVDNSVRVKAKFKGKKNHKDGQNKDFEKSKVQFRRERTPNRIQGLFQSYKSASDSNDHYREESYPEDFVNTAVHHRKERTPHKIQDNFQSHGNHCQEGSYPKDFSKSGPHHRKEHTAHRIPGNFQSNNDYCQERSYPKDFSKSGAHHRNEHTPHRIKGNFQSDNDCQEGSYPKDFSKFGRIHKQHMPKKVCESNVNVTVSTPNSKIKVNDNTQFKKFGNRKPSKQDSCKCDACTPDSKPGQSDDFCKCDECIAATTRKLEVKKPKYFSLLVHGFPETKNENCGVVFQLICSEILDIKGVEVEKAYRIGSQNPRLIAVELLNFKLGHEVLNNAKEKLLKGNLRILSNKPQSGQR